MAFELNYSPALAPAILPSRTQLPEGPLHRLALPGDFPDPTVVKVDGVFWATATAAEWGPVFPLFYSHDLHDWHPAGHVFPDEPPAWAGSQFWAPEFFFDEKDGKTYVTYTARRKNGCLAVAIAVADHPAGPYKDLGPMVEQNLGSIDGLQIRDENGVLYLIWKEDGNSRLKPTPILAQRLAEDRTRLLGKPVELFRNDQAWEGCLVEGSAIIRHEGWFYMIYAGNGCCGRCCNYATGAARAKSLLGPWEKCPANPILVGGGPWKCPGHGSLVGHEDRWFFMHHAYHRDTHEFVGRQGLVTEMFLNEEGWPYFEDRVPKATPLLNVFTADVAEDFSAPVLGPAWQWPVDSRPLYSLSLGGGLQIGASPSALGSVLAQRTFTGNYTATAEVTEQGPEAWAGLAAIGDTENALSIVACEGQVQVWQIRNGKREVLAAAQADTTHPLCLRMHVIRGRLYHFSYQARHEAHWHTLTMPESAIIKGSYLPPWDRGVRVGLVSQGPAGQGVRIGRFEVVNLA